MVRLNRRDHLVGLTEFRCELDAELHMRAFVLAIHGLPDVVEKAGSPGGGRVHSELLSHQTGDNADFLTVALKTIFDQFVYVPIFGLLNVILFLAWREADYSFSRLRKRLAPGWYRDRVLPGLVANWLIWIPAVALIYCFPLALQLPVQNLILCFWILLLTILTSDHSKAADTAAAGGE